MTPKSTNRAKNTRSESKQNKSHNTSPTSTNCENLASIFEHVFKDSKSELIDPFHCIQFTQIRKLTKYGTNKFIHLFDKESKVERNGHSVGHALGLEIPIVVPLTCTNISFVYIHFRWEDVREEYLEERVNAVSVLYGIVEGKHSTKH